MNMLTIDVEDWYMDTDFSTWSLYEDRVVQSTEKILKILDETNTKATLFVVGYVAEQFPELIENIKDRGHEIGTHGYGHKPITKQTPTEFEVRDIKQYVIEISEKIDELMYEREITAMMKLTEKSLSRFFKDEPDIYRIEDLKY